MHYIEIEMENAILFPDLCKTSERPQERPVLIVSPFRPFMVEDK